MSKVKQIDGDLTPEEIQDVEEFHANKKDRVTFDTSEEFIKWLHEDD